MRVKGLHLKGVNLTNYISKTPITIPYSIKYHKYGADATWSQCTDQYRASVGGHAFDAEINGFKYNLALTSFISTVTDSDAGAYTDVSETGRISFGVYERTAHSFSVDPNLDVEKSIVDHYVNIRNGLGYYPSVASYGYGYYDYQEEFKDYYLGVRNSQWDLAEYSYDISDTSSFPTTTRQGDMWSDRETNLGHVGQALENAINAGGWYRDFTHWHTVEDGELEEYFSQQRSIIGNRNVVTLSFMEAIEYMKLRQSITEIKFFEADGKIYVTTEMPYVPTFRRNIETTISVEVDLSGTILEGEEIKTNYGVQKLGNNKFIIEVPIDDYCIIESDINGQYLDFELPTITGVYRNNTVLTVITDKPTNVTVFETPLGGETYQATLRKRSNTMSTVHTINISDIAYLSRDLYVGAITETGQSVLSDKLAGSGDNVVLENLVNLDMRFYEHGVTHTINDGVIDLTVDEPSQGLHGLYTHPNDTVEGHLYLVSADCMFSGEVTTSMGNYSDRKVIKITKLNTWETIMVTTMRGIQTFTWYFNIPNPQAGDVFKLRNLMVIDLTKIFGAGNEPTKEEMVELIKAIGYIDGEYVLGIKVG